MMLYALLFSRRHALFATLVAVLALALPAGSAAAPPQTATLRFGNPDVGSPFSPVSGHDRSSNAKDNLVPRTVVISQGGQVTFDIQGFHQVAIYQAGTRAEDITVPASGLFVNDPTGRIAFGPLNRPPSTTSWTAPAGTFSTPGRYLVICNVVPHFAEFNMYGWVIVQ
jgi:hypothetical protein